MLTKEQIANMGFSELGSSRVSQLDPPRTPLERHVSANFDAWKREELSKRIWVCARRLNYALTLEATETNAALPYVYNIPSEVLRIVRRDGDDWEQEGRKLRSGLSSLSVYVVVDIDVAYMDPLLARALAWRVAQGSAEYVTQSNTKIDRADVRYAQAIREAAKLNAFIKPPELYADSTDTYEFLTARSDHNGL